MNTVVHRQGDLLAATDLDAMAHGCNCRGVMGAFAGAVRRVYGEDMFNDYKTRCQEHTFSPGQCLWWTDVDAGLPLLANLASQYDPGPNARYHWLGWAVDSMCAQAMDPDRVEQHLWGDRPAPRVIGIPRIGSGVGGLNADVVEAILNNIVQDYPQITLIVYTR